MKNLKIWGMMVLVVMALPIMLACGGSGSNDEDDDSGGGSSSGATIKEGWYIPENFISDRVAGLKEEVNYWVQKGYTDGSQYFDAEDLFTNPENVGSGTNWDVVDASMTVIHIIDKKSVEVFGNAFFGRIGGKCNVLKHLLFTVDLGPVVGIVGCYSDGSRFFNYTTTEDGFWFSNFQDYYEEFLVKNGQLFRNGGGRWVKFDPNKVY